MGSDKSRLQKRALVSEGLPSEGPYHSSQPRIEAAPRESASYGRADWPMRQANQERTGGGACSSRRFADQRDSHSPERERSRDAGSDGTRLASRGPRAAKLS